MEGSKANLICNASLRTDDVSLIMWYQGTTGDPLYTYDARSESIPPSTTKSHETGERFNFDTESDTPSLTIEPVRDDDSGEYRCRYSVIIWPSFSLLP